MEQDRGIRKLERYFRSPRIGDDVIKPPMSGVACENIRIALHWLGEDDVGDGDLYDERLAKAVLRFQTKNHHSSRDGFFGPGTRRLLIEKMRDKSGPHIFNRLLKKRRFGSYFWRRIPAIYHVYDWERNKER